MSPQQEKKLTFKRLIQSVGRFYNVKAEDITSARRKKDFVKARQVVAYLAREKLKKSFPTIARVLGGRDHTTAIYSYHKIKDKIERDDGFKNEVKSILLENYIAEKKDNIAEIKFPKQEIESEKPKFIIKSPKDIPPQELSPEHSIRQGDILKKYKEGQTLEEIGKEYNLTRERMRQIVERGLIQSIGAIIKEGIAIDLKEFLKEEKRKHLQAVINKHGILKRKPSSFKQTKRWSRYYDRCRKCGTNIIRHHSHGYCERCYPKTEIFKELQESSRLRNIEKRRRYVKEYSKKYSSRPEIVKKRQMQWDLKYFGGNREKALIRDDERCQFCGISRIESYKTYNKDLIVIHIRDIKDNSLENLLTLCKKCFYEELEKRRKNTNQ